MSHLTRLITEAYSRTLNLYPRRFKDEFADEMNTVFRDSAVDAADEGTLPLMFLCGREFLGMPFNILKEVWHEIQGEDLNMQELSFAPLKPGTWRDAFWAGLPHLLIAILFATTSALANTGLATVSGIILGFLMLVGFLATILYTWRDHWPAWSASWYGYVGLIVLLFSIVPYENWNGLPERPFASLRYVLWLLTLAILLYWFSRRNPIEGLLMATPVIILYWFPVMEFIPNSIRFWLTFWLFLLPGLTAILITRLNNIRTAIWLALGASLLTGLPIAYARTYWNNIPPQHASPPSLGGMAELFTVPWLTSAALALAPILGWGLWSLGKKYDRVGRISAVVTILGITTNLFGHLSYWWHFSGHGFLNALHLSIRPTIASSLFMVGVGFAVTVIGTVFLAWLTWKNDKLLSLTLIPISLALPLVAMFNTYFGNHVIPAGFTFEFVELADAYRYIILLLGVAWLATSGWTITHLYSAPTLTSGAT